MAGVLENAASGFSVRLQGSDELVQRMRTLPERARDSILLQMKAQAAEISAAIKEKLSGPVLNAKTGRLRSGVYARVYPSDKKITLSVGVRGDVPYAAIHEYGGKTRAHEILPTKGRALKFLGEQGAAQYASKVDHPGSRMPERSYVRSTVDEQLGDIESAIEDKMEEAIRRVLLGIG